MTYFFDANKIIICYSDEGQRIMAMRKNSAVSLQVLKMKDVDNWSFVLAHGTFEEITGSDAKKITRFCEWN